MNPRFTIAAIACALGVMASAIPAEARVNQRQARQSHRISQGVSNGSLTARETNRLQRREANIARYEAKSRADGHGYTARERARTQRMQNRTSRAIYHQKHDAQHK
jgi:hypothetical protein